MNYVEKIKDLSKSCLKNSDYEKIINWLNQRDLISIKEIISSEFKKFKKSEKCLDNLNKSTLSYEEQYSKFAELEDTIVEYLRLNAYLEEEFLCNEEY